MILTQGEKMVWAAAFSAALEFKDRTFKSDADAAQWASAKAYAAVDKMRVLGRMPPCCGDPNCTDYQMLRAMLGNEG